MKRKTKRATTPEPRDLTSTKKGRGRYPKGSTSATLEQLEIFLRTIGEGWTATRAAECAKCPRQTFYDLRDNDDRFAAAWKAAEDAGTDALEDIARTRAEGYEKPLTFKGKKTGHTVTEHSDVLVMFMLNGRRPEKFRQNVKIDATVTQGKDFSSALAVSAK